VGVRGLKEEAVCFDLYGEVQVVVSRKEGHETDEFEKVKLGEAFWRE
jgi:hypothetical protein